MYQSQYKAAKYRCLVIENLCDKSGKVLCIKLLLLNFTLIIKCFYKTKYIDVMLT